MHFLYSIIETVLYVFYEAISNKSVIVIVIGNELLIPSLISFLSARLGVGFGQYGFELPLLLLESEGVWAWGLSLSLSHGSLLIRGTLIFILLPLVVLATSHQVSPFATTSTCFPWNWQHLGWTLHMTWKYFHLV